MRPEVNKWNSIYFRLVRLLIIALVCAAAFFALSHLGFQRFLDKTVGDSYQESQNQRRYEEFQKYITENRIPSSDNLALDRWIRQQKDLEMEVYKNYTLVYDSMNPSDTGKNAKDDFYYTWESRYVVTFRDGRAQLVLFGFYIHKVEILLILLRIAATFIIFLLVFLLGIRSEMHYLSQLSSEVAILESGDLTCPITVNGKDELSFLAYSIEKLRIGIQEEIQKNAEVSKASQEMITEMSHDLRTPLTALLLYTEILESVRYEDPGQWKRYVHAIRDKAVMIKELSDNIFEYALIRSERKKAPEEIYGFQDYFYDILSETAEYLYSQGYPVVIEGEWPEGQIRVRTDYVSRIMDNITSNALKYASKEDAVVFNVGTEGSRLTVSVRNSCKKDIRNAESTGIGLVNIRNMMEKMGGSSMTQVEDGFFTVKLFFENVS